MKTSYLKSFNLLVVFGIWVWFFKAMYFDEYDDNINNTILVLAISLFYSLVIIYILLLMKRLSDEMKRFLKILLIASNPLTIIAIGFILIQINRLIFY